MVDLSAYFSLTLDPLGKMLVALAIGLMVGFEREIAQEKMTNVKFAGLRTFGLAGLIGGVTAYLASTGLGAPEGSLAFAPNGYFIFGVALLAIMALLGLAYYRSTGMQPHLGFTTEISLILTFLMGGLAFYNTGAALILAVITTILLAFKQPLHEFTHKIPKEEFYDSLLFALIAIVILPLLPNRDYGVPYPGMEALFNPQQVWLFVVFISGISYIGYFLVKWLGPSAGLAITGIVGGMASSTAVTTTMGANTRVIKGIESEAMVACTLANVVMLLRVALIVLVFNPALLYSLYLPLGVMFVVGIFVASYFYLRSPPFAHAEGQPIRLGSPFSIRPALTFGLLISIILALSKIATYYGHNAGLYVTALFAGLADVDAITISASQLASAADIVSRVAVFAVLIAVFVNLGIRIVYAYYFGTREFGRYTIGMAVVMVVSGLAMAFLI
ncbi:MAG TPA: MgtC/SapB family protein [Methanocella sp.]|nr:MgtC/SapB family protein [Methanocella sp.]